jgi:hypothetical protein
MRRYSDCSSIAPAGRLCIFETNSQFMSGGVELVSNFFGAMQHAFAKDWLRHTNR